MTMNISRIFLVFAAFTLLSTVAQQDNKDKRLRRHRVLDFVDPEEQHPRLGSQIEIQDSFVRNIHEVT